MLGDVWRFKFDGVCEVKAIEDETSESLYDIFSLGLR